MGKEVSYSVWVGTGLWVCATTMARGLDGTGLGYLPGTYHDISGDGQSWLRTARAADIT